MYTYFACSLCFILINSNGCMYYIYHEGTGKGGTSIWGRKFEDEIRETLKVFEIHMFQFI